MPGAQNKGRSSRSTLTANGRVDLQRTRWHRPGAGGSSPVDRLVDLAEATVSLGTRELMCLANSSSRGFAAVADKLHRLGQIHVSPEKLRQVIEQEGKRVLAASQGGGLAPGWQADQCKQADPTGRPVSRVYLSADGFMVPLVTQAEKQARRKQVLAARRRRPQAAAKLPALPRRRAGVDQRYKEFKAVMFHDQDLAHRLVSVTRGDCQQAGRLMRRDALRIGFARADERIATIDGGPWILKQIQRQNLSVTAVGLDFYHLGQNLHQGRRITFGEDDAMGQDWAAQMLQVAKHQGYEALWQGLIQWRGRWRAGAKRQEADRLLHYVSDRRQMINYPQFLAHGWRIGSGPMESQCAVVPDRVKGPGMRWDADNAEAVMALEAINQSNQWKTYWTTCALQSG